MFICQSVDPLSISDERIDANGDESDSGDDGSPNDSSQKVRSEEIVVVSIEGLIFFQ